MSIQSAISNQLNKFSQSASQLGIEYANIAAPLRYKWMKQKSKQTKKGAKVLDVGAGMCPYRHLFTHCNYVTHDFAKYHGTKKGPAADEWQYGNIDIISDIAHIPVKDNTFDTIICTEVFEHIPEPIKALREFGRILKPKGKLLLSAPLSSGLHQEPYHYYGGFTPHFYKLYLKKFGFTNIIIKPEGGFFTHLGQELYRASLILDNKKKFSFISLLIRLIFAKFFWNLEKIIYLPEFTVGYLVEATKT